MIPAQFDYVAPTSVEDALAALAEHGDDAKIIAGHLVLVADGTKRVCLGASEFAALIRWAVTTGGFDPKWFEEQIAEAKKK